MMKTKLLLVLLSFSVFILPSCIKSEADYREADIVNISLPDNVLADLAIDYPQNSISLVVYDTTGFANKRIAPQIEVSPGATIFPASGDSVDLDNYSTVYNVTPENGAGSRTFVVNIVPFIPLKFDFEEWNKVTIIGRTYYNLVDPFWANANSGIALIYWTGRQFPSGYTEDSYSGDKALFLHTAGKRAKIKMLPGSMFRGVFKFNGDMNNPIPSAKFGQIHPKYAGKPTRFTGYYKYKPGEHFQDRNEVMQPDRTDEPDMYAILFEVTKGAAGREEYLTADDLNTSSKIVATAIVEDRSSKDVYTKFDIPFTYTREVDYNKYDYKLAIVFSSSRYGNYFEGAIGSELYVDDVEVECVSFK